MFSAALKHVMTGQSSLTVPGDPLLASNVLLLKTVGRNNLTNAEFLDSSNDQFSVTRTGDVTQGAFSPYVPTGYWSNYFDGTGDRITAAHNAAFRLTGDFTVECWVNFVAVAGRANWLMGCLEFSNETGWMFRYTGTALRFYGAGLGAMDRSWTPTLGVWYHLAVTRSSGDIRMFIDGVQQGAAVSNSTSFSASTALATVGGDPNFGSDTNAFISNARVVNGTAVYTANFTPPTTPLTAISGTSLLTCQDNRFIDRSSNNFTLTQVGDVSVRRFAPFGLSWDSSLGGSGYFDGSGDYLNLGNQTALKLDSGNFTVEAWIWKNANTSYMTLSGDYSAGTNTSCIAADATGTKICWVAANTQSFILTSTASIPVRAWTHIAFVRSSGTLSLYINGALDSSVADSRTYGGTNQYYVGIDAQLINGREWNGYISNYRVVKGTAVYTAAFTPPTSPVTAITNTSLLLNFDNAAVYDATRASNFTLNGTTQTSTAQKNYAVSSVALSTAGGNRGLQTVDRPELRFGTGDFTAELWWRPSGLSGYQTIINKGYSGTGGLALQSNSGLIDVYVNGYVFSAPANRAVTNNAWNHIALVRSAGTVTLWVNGLSAGSASSSADLSSTVDLLIGWETQGGNIYPASGNVEDVRFSRTARYTAAFTPPARALPVSVVGVSESVSAPFSASGGTVTTSGAYTVHTFTSSGSFVVSGTTPKDVEYLVVGGGGGGGGYIGGGGGGGGVRTGTMSINAGTYTVTVGAGGAGGASASQSTAGDGGNGENSVFSTITAAGGGGGAGAYSRSGKNGGSGGGGSNGSGLAGSGNIPSRTPVQGYNGGAGGPDTNYGSGGGGGAGSAGGVGSNAGGNGGNGVGSAISGTQTAYGGGGGGASYFGTGGAGNGGGGYGGAGTGSNTPYLPIAGTANRGGGGGGGAITNYPDLTTGPGAAGGSGIVIVRYLT